MAEVVEGCGMIKKVLVGLIVCLPMVVVAASRDRAERAAILLSPVAVRDTCVPLVRRAEAQVVDLLERETRLELATPTLARSCSTN